jgi:DNA-binding LytR/AlgR family response regulator
MTYRCIIVDDEPLARKVLTEYIEDIDFLELKGTAENPLKASALLTGNDVNLLFLDINMPKLSGLAYLRSSTSLPLTILTTAYAEYALDGFDLNVIDYLVKPFSFERFLQAVGKAKAYLDVKISSKPDDHEKENFFFVKCDGKMERMLYDELLYVEAMLNYVILHTAARKMIVYLTIKGLIDQLPSHRFVKVHTSYIVNVSKIKSIDKNGIDIGPTHIPISQSLYETVLNDIVKDKLIKR